MTSLSMTPAPLEQQGTPKGRQQRAAGGGQRSSTRTRRPQADIALYSPRGCAAPGSVPGQGNTQERLSKLEAASSQRKIVVTCKSPVGDISAVTLIRTDTTLDHSQKAEKVCLVRTQTAAVTARKNEDGPGPRNNPFLENWVTAKMPQKPSFAKARQARPSPSTTPCSSRQDHRRPQEPRQHDSSKEAHRHRH